MKNKNYITNKDLEKIEELFERVLEEVVVQNAKQDKRVEKIQIEFLRIINKIRIGD